METGNKCSPGVVIDLYRKGGIPEIVIPLCEIKSHGTAGRNRLEHACKFELLAYNHPC
jgi:hypothetical protein